MNNAILSYKPGYDEVTVRLDLHGLFVHGPLRDDDLGGRIARLSQRFRAYSESYPFGLWAPGLAVTDEMGCRTETYLPYGEIWRALKRLLAVSSRFPSSPTMLHKTSGWLEFLHRMQPLVQSADPSAMLRRLATDESYRLRFHFACAMPGHFGGGFGRYPAQSQFLEQWIIANRARLSKRISCLDAACGSGEGTYELALLLGRCGYRPSRSRITGTSLDPCELFAAAHAFFPHDALRQEAFRARIGTVLDNGWGSGMLFSLEDVTGEATTTEKYDVVLCNGLLGGPLLHDGKDLAVAVGKLAARLAPHGILMAADRFHAGWRKRVPGEFLAHLLKQSGLQPISVPEGVGAVGPSI